MIANGTPAVLGGRPAFERLVPILRPTLPDVDEMAAQMRAVLASGQLTNGENVRRFEVAAARYLGVAQCVATSSCTSGLMLTLRALGVMGDVVLPSFTFFATAHAAVWNGLTPVFADCDPETFNTDAACVERALTPRTSAILAAHLYGNPLAIEPLEQLARRRGLRLVTDAAHAFGSRRSGRSLGGDGDAEIFSLSPTKTVIAAEGGLVATDDADLARQLRAGRNYGDSGDYDPEFVGLNARMSELHAVLALASFAGVEADVARRNAIARRYEDRLGKLAGLRFQRVREEDRSTFKDFSILVDPPAFGLERDALCRALKAENVDVRRYFSPPVHRQRMYRGRATAPLPHTDAVANAVVSLPIYQSLGDDEVDGICSAIERVAGHAADVARALERA